MTIILQQLLYRLIIASAAVTTAIIIEPGDISEYGSK
jgi:hypothetical protein